MIDSFKLLYRTQEAAKLLGISNSMVRKLIASKHIHIIRLGERAVRISAAELQRIVNGDSKERQGLI